MTTTVYFVTNRDVQNAQDTDNGYPATMVPPSDPNKMTYGVATVDQIDIPGNGHGKITQITDTSKGDFSDQVKARLANPGNDLLIFIHGFDNSFSNAITRAAFNREWLFASGLPGTDTTVIAFCWPSLGEFLGFPDLTGSYKSDRHMATNSGMAVMTFLSRLQPLLMQAQGKGRRSTILAHSMGNLALESGLENWFLNGNGPGFIFDLAVLAAGDCRHDTFDQPDTVGMKGLASLAKQISIYYSRADQVLQLSMFVNGSKRLGQDGPHNRADQNEFPPEQYFMNDCSDVMDYNTFNPLSSHQYYRTSPTVRALIASQMAGGAAASILTASLPTFQPNMVRSVTNFTTAAMAAATAPELLKGFDANRDCGRLIDKIIAANVDFVMRYYSHNITKNLSFSEARLLSAAGIKIVTVWEAQGDRATSFSHATGVDDATTAYTLATALGQPSGTPIYFAVDFDASQAVVTGAIHDYFQGVADGFATISRNRPVYTIGVYGSGLVCSWLKGRKLVTRTWLSQSKGWTGSRTFKDWDILQHPESDPYGFGFTIDPDNARPDYGGFTIDAFIA